MCASAGVDERGDELLVRLRETSALAIAPLMARLPPDEAAQIMERLRPEQRLATLRDIAGTRTDASGHEALDAKVAETTGHRPVPRTGPEAAADVLGACRPATEKAVLSDLLPVDPELAEHLRRLLFDFDDLHMLDDFGIEAMLMEVEVEELALALKGGGGPTGKRIVGLLSDRAATTISDAMRRLSAPTPEAVGAARRRLAATALRLERDGGLTIPWRQGDWR